jgi:septin 6/8/11
MLVFVCHYKHFTCFYFSLSETYEQKRQEHVAELQKKEEEMRQTFVIKVKEKEAELKEAEKDV